MVRLLFLVISNKGNRTLRLPLAVVCYSCLLGLSSLSTITDLYQLEAWYQYWFQANTSCPGYSRASALQQLQQPLYRFLGEVLVLVAFQLLFQEIPGNGILGKHETTLPVKILLEDSR